MDDRLIMGFVLWGICWNTYTSIPTKNVIVYDEDCGSDVSEDYNVTIIGKAETFKVTILKSA